MSCTRSSRPEPPAPQPPPLPPPPAKPGNYAGTYSDGTFFKVFVDSPGAHALDVYFDFNGDCSNGGTSWDTGYVMNGPFAIRPDGTFSGTATTTFSDSTVSAIRLTPRRRTQVDEPVHGAHHQSAADDVPGRHGK